MVELVVQTHEHPLRSALWISLLSQSVCLIRCKYCVYFDIQLLRVLVHCKRVFLLET